MPEPGRRSRWEDERKDQQRSINGRTGDELQDSRRRYQGHVLSDEASGSRRRDSERGGREDRDAYDREQRGSRHHGDESYRRKRRSQSPDFARDRARERDAYDRKYDIAAIRDDGNDKLGDEPDFKPSGLLAKESNSKNGVSLKYFEPPEARKPRKKWRLYVFKEGKEVGKCMHMICVVRTAPLTSPMITSDMLHISRQSCYLIGRDATVADIPVDHASVSKQHCVVQYRSQTERNEFGDEKRTIKPFLIDLESSNGSFVNKVEVPPSRYYELKNGDTITLADCDRDFVILMED